MLTSPQYVLIKFQKVQKFVGEDPTLLPIYYCKVFVFLPCFACTTAKLKLKWRSFHSQVYGKSLNLRLTIKLAWLVCQRKKNKGRVASRNVTKTQDEDFSMNSVAQCYGQYLTNVMVFRTNEVSINSTMIRCSPMMLVNLQ